MLPPGTFQNSLYFNSLSFCDWLSQCFQTLFLYGWHGGVFDLYKQWHHCIDDKYFWMIMKARAPSQTRVESQAPARVAWRKSKKFIIGTRIDSQHGKNKDEVIKSRAHICHKYHKLYLWRKNCHVEKFWKKIGKFWEILPQFTRFHLEKNWAQKVHLWRKMTNMRSCLGKTTLPLLPSYVRRDRPS